MPKTAAQLDAVAVIEAEHPRIQVAGGRQAPVQPVADQLPEDLGLVAVGVLRQDGQLQDPLADLHPTHRHADQSRRTHAPELFQQRVDRGVAREDVGSAPEDGAQHLQIPAEGVVEGEIAQQGLVASHFGQGRGAGEAFGHEVVLVEGHALGPPRAAGGEHHGRAVAQAAVRPPGQELLDLFAVQLRALLCEQAHVVAALTEPLDQGVDDERTAGALAYREQLVQAVGMIAHRGGDLQPVEDPDQVLGGEVHVERRDEDALGQTRQVAAGRPDAVVAEQGDARFAGTVGVGIARLGAGFGQEHGGDGPDPAVDLGIAPAPAARTAHLPEEDLARMGRCALLEQLAQIEIYGLDDPERGLGPAHPCRGVGQEGQEVGIARLFEIGQPGRAIRAAAPVGRQQSLGAGQDPLGGGLGTMGRDVDPVGQQAGQTQVGFAHDVGSVRSAGSNR